MVLVTSDVWLHRLHLHVGQPWATFIGVVASHMPACGGRLCGGAPAAAWLLLAVHSIYEHGRLRYNTYEATEYHQWWYLTAIISMVIGEYWNVIQWLKLTSKVYKSGWWLSLEG